MSKGRKTFPVADLKSQINDFLLNSPDSMARERQHSMCILEPVLMQSNNYHGFRYLSAECMEKSYEGTTVGYNVSRETPAESMTHEECFKDTDSTRVQFL